MNHCSTWIACQRHNPLRSSYVLNVTQVCAGYFLFSVLSLNIELPSNGRIPCIFYRAFTRCIRIMNFLFSPYIDFVRHRVGFHWVLAVSSSQDRSGTLFRLSLPSVLRYNGVKWIQLGNLFYTALIKVAFPSPRYLLWCSLINLFLNIRLWHKPLSYILTTFENFVDNFFNQKLSSFLRNNVMCSVFVLFILC